MLSRKLAGPKSDGGDLSKSLGVILSGGGARGAYEAGVLSYVFGDLARANGRAPRFDIVSGTSVGAINGAYLASYADDPAAGVSRLAELWRSLTLGQVFGFGIKQMSRLYRVLLGGGPKDVAGLLDATPLTDLITREARWDGLTEHLASGRLRAVSVSTTQVTTGKTVVWVGAGEGVNVPPALPGNVVMRRDTIRPEHVLASAAIPILFPPVLIGSELYVDGGVRLNTPMAPAIHFGAEKLLVIGVSTPVGAQGSIPALAMGHAPGATFLLGKVMNAFLLDHLNSDLEELERINHGIRAGLAAFGPTYLDQLNAELVKDGTPPRRVIDACTVKPSRDIGRLAGEYLRRNVRRMKAEMGTTFLRVLDLGEGADADLASYLLFDGEFAGQLIDLGRSDAAAMRDELSEFLFDS